MTTEAETPRLDFRKRRGSYWVFHPREWLAMRKLRRNLRRVYAEIYVDRDPSRWRQRSC